MTHLNIQQGLNIEVVSTNLIKKLYEAALSVPEPLEGELDAAYMSGNLLVAKSYRALVEYLTNRFDDLHINVTDSYYIPLEDSAVLNVLLANNIGSDGIGITEAEAANATLTAAMFLNNTDITSFDTFKYFTKANTNPPINLFRGCTNLSSINLLNTSNVSADEFSGSGITAINAPNLEFIGSSAFSLCNLLTHVYNLGSIISLPDRCFWGSNNLESVVLPNSCTSLGNLAIRPSGYNSSNITNINLENITSIGDECFASCGNLSIDVLDLLKCVSIGNSGFQQCYTLYGELYLPNLISLGGSSFRSCQRITKVKCLGKITEIPNNCFMRHPASLMNLTEVYIPYECTSIGQGAFAECVNLTTVKQYIDSVDDWIEGLTPTYTNISRITSFGSSCFEGDSLLSLTGSDLANAVTIGDGAFKNSGITGNLNLPNLTSLGQYAFQNSPITGTLNLPNLTGVLRAYTFSNTHISSISSLGNVTEIQLCAFLNTAISSISIPNSVKKCACAIVDNTIVSEIIFPEGVEEITDGLFYTKNNSLTYIEIPSTVTNMGIFFHRSLETSQNNLCTVVIKATTPPELNYYSSLEIDATRGDKFAGIYVPDSSLTAYQNGTNAWLHSSIQAKLKPISQLLTDNPTAWAKYNRTSTV